MVSTRQLPFLSSNQRREALFGAAFFLAALATRVPFLSSYLYAHDTIRLALGMHDFNVAKHQPHPPGYILYVGLLRYADAILHNATLSLTLMSAVFAALSVALIYYLATSLFDDHLAAVLVSCMWITCPLLWYYSEIGESYPAGACMSVATALSTLAFWKQPSGKSAILAGAVFAAGAGVRQDQSLFLAPVAILPMLFSKSCRRHLAPWAASLVLAYLAWYVPLAELCGGFKKYSALVHRQFVTSASGTSVFLGASASNHLRMLVGLGAWLTLGILPCLILAPLFLAYMRKRVTGSMLDGPRWLFLMAWFAPFVLFFAAFHVSKPGYLLPALPPLMLLLGRWIAVQIRRIPKRVWAIAVSLVLIVAVNFGYFFAMPMSVWKPEPQAASVWSARLRLLPFLWKQDMACCTYDEIRTVNAICREYFAAIRSIVAEGPTELIIFAPWTPYPDWYNIMYYFPRVPVYGMLNFKPHAIASVALARVTELKFRADAWRKAPEEVASIGLLPGYRALIMIPTAKSDVAVTLPREEATDARDVTPRLPDPRHRVYRLLLVDRPWRKQLRLESEFGSVAIAR